MLKKAYLCKNKAGDKMNNLDEMNDAALLDLLGERVKKERLNQNTTQTELAQRAGIDRMVLARLENGKGCTLTSMIKILRTLGKINGLELFLPEPGISPVQLAKLAGHQRQEASGRRGRPPKKGN